MIVITRIIRKNGISARTLCSRGIFAIELHIKRNAPTGGVIAPTCIVITINTPKWMGSNPKVLPAARAGAANMAIKTGGSRKQPRINRNIIINNEAMYGLPMLSTANWINLRWKLSLTRIFPSTPAMVIVIMTTAVVVAESISIFGSFFKVSSREMQKPYTRPYRLAIIPDSVGVKTPRTIPNRMINGMTRAKTD
jgi:hypothetical protein